MTANERNLPERARFKSNPRVQALKFIPHLVWMIGAVILLFAFGDHSGASLPYQDPTPELLAVQQGQIESAKTEAWIGGVIFMSGFAWVFIRRRSRSAPGQI